MKLLLAIGSPLVVLGIIEVVLRIGGFGYSTDFFIRTRDGGAYTLNEQFRRQYYPGQRSVRGHPFKFGVEKGTNTVRIFVLGESAALGTPNPSFGFARMLGVMLRERYPERRFEVINAAMRGINSHIIRHIAHDCAKHQPDIAVVYAGNNEVVGFGAPDPGSPLVLQNLAVIQGRQVLRRTKLAQLVDAGAERLKRSMAAEQGMDYFRRQRLSFDDARRQCVYRNFRSNLEDICRSLTSAGCRVLLSTVPVNVVDFPPIGSLHRPFLSEAEKSEWERLYKEGARLEQAGQTSNAIVLYQRAAQIDDHFAELHFRIGRSLFALGQFEQGRLHYKLARDRDALQFRADSPINSGIRDVGKELGGHGVWLVDAEDRLGNSPLGVAGLPGNRLFLDHVHPRFDGDYTLACVFYEAITSILGDDLDGAAKARRPPLSRDECAAAIAFTGWDALEIDAAIAEMLSRPPFLDQLDHETRIKQLQSDLQAREAEYKARGLERELGIYRRAIERSPDDWELHYNFGVLLNTVGQHEAAIEHFRLVVKEFPDSAWCVFHLAETLVKARRFSEAEQQLRRILDVDPGFAPARDLLQPRAAGRRRVE
ncbi:MAG: tetratricopeptide repeat protein [Verrucomicrobia bacterium]|nr:tetratricopeptide repeat protein [Verrucomicrobiota bacterium]